MKLKEALEIAQSSDRIPEDVAEEIMTYGISAILAEGLRYNEAIEIITKAEISLRRHRAQSVSF